MRGAKTNIRPERRIIFRVQPRRVRVCGRQVPMARRKKKRLVKQKEARRRARAGIGQPPPERIIPDKRKKAPRHKEILAEIEDI